MSITLTCDSTRAKKKLDRINKGITRIMPHLGIFAGKMIAYRAGEYTLPTSKGNDWPVEKLVGRIEEDINNAYPSQSDHDWEFSAFDLLKQYKGEDVAKSFWAKYKDAAMVSGKGKSENEPLLEAEEIFRKAKIPKSINPQSQSQLKKSKFGYRGNVYRLTKKPFATAMVQSDRRANFIARQTKRAGLAKSAWWQAASSYGGDTNFKRSKVVQGQYVWPKEAAIVQKGAGNHGIGMGWATVTNGKVTTSVRSNLRYASQALPTHLQTVALHWAGIAIKKYMDLRFQYGFRKGEWKEAS
jgi:hypothetical protein